MITPQPCSFFLIEDNAADVDLITRVLKKADKSTQIYLAQDGEEAIEMLNNWSGNIPNPMIVLLDLKLPKIDGLDVLKIIKENSRLKPLPVVVLTSSNQNQDIEKAYLLGANSYVIKAIDFDEFSKAIEMIQKYWSRLNVYPF
ncbi:MAG TPA: two-component system response regulator [Anaerolineae bacterium]|jgi:CheY-like chemotaxis protein|nr:response regulator [Anaerolineae bacterium]HAE59559.1 two-component system response regulator [Anaerolineae bacterium]